MKRLLLFSLILFGMNAVKAQDTWTQKANLGGGDTRVDGVGFSIGDKGYAGTGIDFVSQPTQDFWEYNPATNIWTQKVISLLLK